MSELWDYLFQKTLKLPPPPATTSGGLVQRVLWWRRLTKWVPPPVKMTSSYVRQNVDISRKRMDVPSLDMLQFHWYPPPPLFFPPLSSLPLLPL